MLDRLYLIATWPVRQAMDDGSKALDDGQQYVCRLLARVVAELASPVCSTEVGNFHRLDFKLHKNYAIFITN